MWYISLLYCGLLFIIIITHSLAQQVHSAAELSAMLDYSPIIYLNIFHIAFFDKWNSERMSLSKHTDTGLFIPY